MESCVFSTMLLLFKKSCVFSTLLLLFKKSQALTFPTVPREVSGFSIVRERPSVIFLTSLRKCQTRTAVNYGHIVLYFLQSTHLSGSLIRCHGCSIILYGSEDQHFDITLQFQTHRNTKVTHGHFENHQSPKCCA